MQICWKFSGKSIQQHMIGRPKMLRSVKFSSGKIFHFYFQIVFLIFCYRMQSNKSIECDVFKLIYKIVSFWIEFHTNTHSIQIKPDARVPWGGGGQITQEIPLNNANNTQTNNIKLDGFYLVNLTDAMANLTNFNVFMKSHVIDSRRCAGNETSLTYKGKRAPALYFVDTS